MVQHIVLIDPDSTSAQRIADTNSRVQIAGVHSGGKTISGGVPETDGIFFGLEFGNRADWTENLFLHDLHVLTDAAEDSRLDEVTLLSVALAANLDLRTLLPASVDVSVAWLGSSHGAVVYGSMAYPMMRSY